MAEQGKQFSDLPTVILAFDKRRPFLDQRGGRRIDYSPYTEVFAKDKKSGERGIAATTGGSKATFFPPHGPFDTEDSDYYDYLTGQGEGASTTDENVLDIQKRFKESGDAPLFIEDRTPPELNTLYTTDKGSHLASFLLGTIASKHKDNIPTYERDLTRDSARLVKKMVERGHMKENPNVPLEKLEELSKQPAQPRESYNDDIPETMYGVPLHPEEVQQNDLFRKLTQNRLDERSAQFAQATQDNLPKPFKPEEVEAYDQPLPGF